MLLFLYPPPAPTRNLNRGGKGRGEGKKKGNKEDKKDSLLSIQQRFSFPFYLLSTFPKTDLPEGGKRKGKV